MATKVIPTTRTDGGWHQKPFADKSMVEEVQADLAKESKRESRGVSWDLHQRECDKNEALEYEIETLKAEVTKLEKEDRRNILLNATYDILVKCDEGPYVKNVLEQTAIWDDSTCDGFCLMTEIADLLGRGEL